MINILHHVICDETNILTQLFGQLVVYVTLVAIVYKLYNKHHIILKVIRGIISMMIFVYKNLNKDNLLFVYNLLKNYLYYQSCQYFNPVEKHPTIKGAYIINYSIGLGQYKTVVKRRRGPAPLIMFDEDNNEVTDIYNSFGTMEQLRLTPSVMCLKQLNIEYNTGESKTFDENTAIDKV